MQEKACSSVPVPPVHLKAVVRRRYGTSGIPMIVPGSNCLNMLLRMAWLTEPLKNPYNTQAGISFITSPALQKDNILAITNRQQQRPAHLC